MKLRHIDSGIYLMKLPSVAVQISKYPYLVCWGGFSGTKYDFKNNDTIAFSYRIEKRSKQIRNHFPNVKKYIYDDNI